MTSNPGVDLSMTLRTTSPEETRSIGRAIGRACRGGEVLYLQGDLGSGKTCFTQGLAAGLDIPTPVTSPTFTLHGEYVGRLILNHLDLYRLDDPAGLASLGILDLLGEAGTVAAVEWPELLDECGQPGGECLKIEIRHLGPEERELVLTAYGPRHGRLLTSDSSVS